MNRKPTFQPLLWAILLTLNTLVLAIALGSEPYVQVPRAYYQIQPDPLPGAETEATTDRSLVFVASSRYSPVPIAWIGAINVTALCLLLCVNYLANKGEKRDSRKEDG